MTNRAISCTIASLLSLIPLVALAAPAPFQPAADEPHLKVRPSPAKDSSLRSQFSLDAAAGYTYHLVPTEETAVHGAVVEASFSLLLSRSESQATKLGLRLKGLVSPEMEGTVTSSEYGDGSGAGRMWGFGGGFLLDHRGFWLSGGFDLVFMNTIPGASSYSEGSPSIKGKDLMLFELYLSTGYDIHLHRHLALRLGAEMGTMFLTCRLQGTAGLVLLF